MTINESKAVAVAVELNLQMRRQHVSCLEDGII